MIDEKARRILFDAYWSKTGWQIPRREPTSEDLAYAIRAGIMFEPLVFTHDAALDRLIRAKSLTNAAAVASAFVASLSRRQVHLRPALGSFFIVQRVMEHQFDGDVLCERCRLFRSWEHDFSSTNFSLLKWGALPRFFGVDHAFVLEQFVLQPRAEPSDSDVAILSQLLEAADSLNADARARDLEHAFKPLLRSNQAERDILIEILLTCGVLSPSRTSSEDVNRIPLRSNWTDAAALWRGDDGVSPSTVKDLFRLSSPEA